MASSRKKKKKKKEKRSVAGATRRRREEAERGMAPSCFELPEDTDRFELKSTKSIRVDLIPYEVGEGNPKADAGELYWERTYYIHRGVGPEQEWIVCPARTAKKKCPICEFIAKLQKDPEADEETIRALRPSKRMLMNVVDMTDDERIIKIWDISHNYFGRAMDEALESSYEDDDDNMDNFCDLIDGSYLKLVVEKGWQGKGFSVERIDFKSRKEDLEEDILEDSHCLDDLLIIKDYDELKELLLAGEEEEEEEDEEPKKKKKKKKKRKKEEEDEDEGEDEEENEEEEEEEEEPRKKKKKKRKKEEEDEDEDEDNWDDDNWDENEEEEEEEEEPRKKKKKKRKKSSKKKRR